MRVPVAVSALALAVALGGGCDETDVVAVKLTLDGALAGKVSVCRLTMPEAGGPLEDGSAGVTWSQRAQVVCSSGEVTDVALFTLGDLHFTRGAVVDGLGWLRVHLPRGPTARWPALLTLVDDAVRAEALAALGTSNTLKGIGETVKIELDLPHPLVTQGLRPDVNGVSAEVDGQHAELLVPLDVALAEGDELVWTLTWEP